MFETWPQEAAELTSALKAACFPRHFAGAGSALVQGLPARLDHLIAEALAVAPSPLQASSRALAEHFIAQLPAQRARLQEDAEAGYRGDPAADSVDEVIFAYPSTMLLILYRSAHVLQQLRIPLLPRMLSAYAHSLTGADIHPAAHIGRSFFIDHVTGVVIGETAQLGDRVRLYQGVTLGALSFPRDAAGNFIRGTKRHPTLEDDVTVYAGATILGGGTVIGARSAIGAAAFITRSIPADTRIALRTTTVSQHILAVSCELTDNHIDFQI